MPQKKRRRFFMTGLTALLPALLTLYLFYVVIIWIHERVGTQFNKVFGISEQSWRVFVGDAIAFLALLVLVWFAGFLIATYFGRMFFSQLDRAFRRVPVVRVVYPAVKQVCDFFLQETAIPFNRVVAIEYPRRGIRSIGFVTGHGLSDLVDEDGERLMSVFVPTSPAPLTGFTIFVPRAEIQPLDLTVDEAAKLIVSGGVVVPGRKALVIGDKGPGALDAGPTPPDKEA